MNYLLLNIKQLITIADSSISLKKGNEMSQIDIIENAFLIIENGIVVSFGNNKDFQQIVFSKLSDEFLKTAKIINCNDKVVFPGFVDSHTHLIFAKSREDEFVMRIKGKSYEEIAKNGGGILNSASKLAETSEEILLMSALNRINEIAKTGTVAVEIKSGYGLTLESELKMLRVAKKIKQYTNLSIKTTLLGAHAVPLEYKNKREDYIKLVCDEMIPCVAEEKLADYIDVFCETGFFTPHETELILDVGQQYGLKGRVHANELGYSGGVQAGVNANAVSVDHLECVGEEEIAYLLNSNTLATLLPATAFFLNIPYAPARKMIDQGLPVVLASDFNPGTCPTGNMPLVMAIAVTQMKMTPEEALVASTLNGAAALELSATHGKISVGMPANIVISENVSSYYDFSYFFGTSLISETIVSPNLIVIQKDSNNVLIH